MDFSKEADFQAYIAKDRDLQKDIYKLLELDFERTKFEKEVEFINGIYCDFSLFESGKIRAIVECKGAKINVTDYVRGIGQIFQYEYFAENSLSNRSYEFCELKDFSSVYIFPDAVIKNNAFNVGLFKYPQSKKILEVNSSSLAVRLIDENELKKLSANMNENRIMISQYYIHDTRIFEFYFLLRVLVIYKLKRIKIHRQELEKELIHRLTMLNNKLEMPNINGLRNMFITLNQLGLIVNNIPTERGFILANLDYSDFALQFFEYLRPYFEVLLGILEKNSDLEQSKIFDLISQKYGGKEVIWLAEFQKKDRGKNTRYISSYLNILRDGYGVLDFAPRSSNRKILFNPLQTNERAFKEHIEKFSKYNDYKEIFERILREI